MRVVFLANVPQVANAGDVKEVAKGYGRNYLLPRKLAALATPAALKQLEEQQRAAARRARRMASEAGDLAALLNGLTITITPKVGSQGRIYGSVTNAHVAAELEKVTGTAIDRRWVLLKNPIRRLGSYPVEVRLSHDASASITVNVPGLPARQAGPGAEVPTPQAPAGPPSQAPPEETASPADKAPTP